MHFSSCWFFQDLSKTQPLRAESDLGQASSLALQRASRAEKKPLGLGEKKPPLVYLGQSVKTHLCEKPSILDPAFWNSGGWLEPKFRGVTLESLEFEHSVIKTHKAILACKGLGVGT